MISCVSKMEGQPQHFSHKQGCQVCKSGQEIIMYVSSLWSKTALSCRLKNKSKAVFTPNQVLRWKRQSSFKWGVSAFRLRWWGFAGETQKKPAAGPLQISRDEINFWRKATHCHTAEANGASWPSERTFWIGGLTVTAYLNTNGPHGDTSHRRNTQFGVNGAQEKGKQCLIYKRCAGGLSIKEY